MRNVTNFCILPFLHLEIQPSGSVYVCCHSNNQIPIGNLHEKTLLEIWQSTVLKKIREKFLSGKGDENAHCQDCFFQESIGMESWRMKENKNWSHHVESFQDLDNLIFPKSLSIRFSNLCNFACRSCKPSTSTAWFADAKFLNPKGNFKKLNSAPKNNPLVEQIKPFAKHMEHIYFAGGEPLMEKEHYEILEFFSRENPNVNLSYDTNFSIFSLGEYCAFDYWPKFKKLFLSTSVDGIGLKGEYIRKGFDWSMFLSNWKLAKENLPDAKLQMNFTLSIYNSLHVLDCVEEFKKLNLLKDGDLDISLVEEPKWLSLQALPLSIKNHIKNEYLKYISGNDWPIVNKKLNEAIKFMMSVDHSNLFKEFKFFTKKLDFIRSEDFTKTFEEESKLFEFESGVEIFQNVVDD